MSVRYIEMPNLGESVTEASISTWLVEEGDQIDKYDPVAEAISDKVTTEIPSSYSGVVKEFLVGDGEDIEIGAPIISIEVEESEEAETEVKEELVNEQEKTDNNEKDDTKQEKKDDKKNIKVSTENKTRYSPAVIRVAQERGIDLNQVEGSGKYGRITRKDVENFDIDSLDQETEETPKEQPPVEQPTTTEKAAENKTSTQELGRKQVVPADGVRKAIAKKMTESVNEIPHAWMTVEADVSNLVSLRDKTKTQFKEKEGVSLSYFPFFLKAVVQALKKHPELNTSWEKGNIVYHQDINLSIAVATEDHLYVPVIHEADQYSITGLAKEVNRLAVATREGKLSNEDMQGGTITVNNTGSFGTVQSMGIINHPQVAILQVESIKKEFLPTEDGGFKVADMVNLCLSIDHRVLDGLKAGRFLQEVKENLTRFKNESDLY